MVNMNLWFKYLWQSGQLIYVRKIQGLCVKRYPALNIHPFSFPPRVEGDFSRFLMSFSNFPFTATRIDNGWNVDLHFACILKYIKTVTLLKESEYTIITEKRDRCPVIKTSERHLKEVVPAGLWPLCPVFLCFLRLVKCCSMSNSFDNYSLVTYFVWKKWFSRGIKINYLMDKLHNIKSKASRNFSFPAHLSSQDEQKKGLLQPDIV